MSFPLDSAWRAWSALGPGGEPSFTSCTASGAIVRGRLQGEGERERQQTLRSASSEHSGPSRAIGGKPGGHTYQPQFDLQSYAKGKESEYESERTSPRARGASARASARASASASGGTRALAPGLGGTGMGSGGPR